MSDPQNEAAPAAVSEETPAPQQAPDVLADVTSRLDQLSKGQEDLQRFLTEQAYQQPQEQFDPYQQYGPQEPEQPDFTDPQAVQQYINEQVQQGLAPVHEQQYMAGVNGLMERYPELGTDNDLAGKVMQSARGATGAERPSVQALEMAYKAMKADQIAAGQKPVADNPAPQLEPAGASPSEQEPDLAQQILAASPRNSFLG